MLHKIKWLSIAMGLGAVVTTQVAAADVEANVVTKDLTSAIPFFMGMENVDTNGYAKEQKDQFVLDALSRNEELAKHAPAKVTQKGPASGISYFEVGHVFSTDYGLEGIQSWETITKQNHGGTNLFVYVWQYGYGNANNAMLNGISKSPALSEVRCGSDLHQCGAGETVTGWLYGWDYSGQSSGYFQASSVSTAHPVGQYWSDSINIR